MKIARNTLIEHLKRVHCEGMIPQASFRGAFETVAAAPDNAALVVASGIEDVDPLEEPVGIQDLGRFIDVLRVGTADPIDVQVAAGRLILQLGGTRVALVTCDPELTTTWVDDEQVEAIAQAVEDDGDGHSLSLETITTAVTEGRILASKGKATDSPAVRLICKSGHVGLRYGHSTQDMGLVELPDVSTDYDDVRSLFADAVISVLKAVGDDARIWPGAPGSFVTVRSGGVTYYLSPRDEEE